MAKLLSLHRKETSSMQSMIQIYFNLETDRLVYIYNRVLLYLYLEIILFEWFLIETYLIIIGCSCLWFVSYEGDQWVLVVNEGKCAKIVLISSLISFLFLFFTTHKCESTSIKWRFKLKQYPGNRFHDTNTRAQTQTQVCSIVAVEIVMILTKSLSVWCKLMAVVRNTDDIFNNALLLAHDSYHESRQRREV